MRFTELARDLATRVRAKPRKIELVKLLRKTTTDRLNSIFEQYWDGIYPEIKSTNIRKAVIKAVSISIADLERNALHNESWRLTHNDYSGMINTLSDIITWNKESTSTISEKRFFEQLIATIPTFALKELWYKAMMINWKTTLRKTQLNDLNWEE